MRRHPELGLLVTRRPSVDIDGGRAAEAGQAHRGLFAPRSDGRASAAGRVPTRLGVPREGRRPPSRGSGRAARQGRAAGGRSSLPGVELASLWQPAGRCPDRAAGLPSGLKLCCAARRRLLTAHRAPWHFQCVLRARLRAGGLLGSCVWSPRQPVTGPEPHPAPRCLRRPPSPNPALACCGLDTLCGGRCWKPVPGGLRPWSWGRVDGGRGPVPPRQQLPRSRGLSQG